MPLLTNIEQRGIEKTRKQDISDLLISSFGNLPEDVIEDIGKIQDINILKQLLISTISVSSLEEFAQLVNSHLPAAD